MFWAIRRFILSIILGLFCLGLLFIYQHRAVFRPLLDLKEIYETRGPEAPKIGTWQGQGVRALDGQSIEIQSMATRLQVGLTGLQAPIATPRSNAAERQLALDCTKHLTSLVQSQAISVAVTFAQPPSGLGLVTLNGTNLNARLLREGKAKLNRGFIKNLSVNEQFELIKAEREARTLGQGIWKSQNLTLTN